MTTFDGRPLELVTHLAIMIAIYVQIDLSEFSTSFICTTHYTWIALHVICAMIEGLRIQQFIRFFTYIPMAAHYLWMSEFGEKDILPWTLLHILVIAVAIYNWI